MIKGGYTIFNNINSDEYTDQEKLHSIKDILSLATHNSITKDSIITAFRWMYDYCLEEASRPQTNGDKVRAMADETLAITIMCPNETGLAEIECDHSDNCNCYECCLKWLKEEVAADD